MCSILHLLPGQMPTMEMLCNAVWNNWHSYGLVTRFGKKLQVIRKVPKDGEVSPKEVWDLLEKHKEDERFLHLRHVTAGQNDEANCHPFDVFHDSKRTVVAMHNGTMYPFVSKKTETTSTGYRVVDDHSGPSDTKNFVDQILTPYLSALKSSDGSGDIHNPLFKKILDHEFQKGTNRLVLISSDQEPLFLGDWKEIDRDGVKFRASNDEYFKDLSTVGGRDKNAPEYLRRQAKKAEEEAKKPKATFPLSNYKKPKTFDAKELSKGQAVHDFFKLSESCCDILNDWDVYDRSSAVALGGLTVKELDEIHSNKSDCVSLMDWIFTDYAKLYEEFEELGERHQRASKRIELLTKIVSEGGLASKLTEEVEKVLEEEKKAA